MIIQSTNHTSLSFTRLSDHGIINASELSKDGLDKSAFNAANFQYIVNHIAEMFGYPHGYITVKVEVNDAKAVWTDINRNNLQEPWEIGLQFTMSANMNSYQRTSTYGHNFMACMSGKYGYPVTFAIAAHEVGHLITNHALNQLTTCFENGRTGLILLRRPAILWQEMCADYLAGAVLALSNPPLDNQPFKAFLSATKASESHPSGSWRVQAVEMGSLWARSFHPSQCAAVLSSIDSVRELLSNFFMTFYHQVYSQTPPAVRSEYGELPFYLLQDCNLLLGWY